MLSSSINTHPITTLSNAYQLMATKYSEIAGNGEGKGNGKGNGRGGAQDGKNMAVRVANHKLKEADLRQTEKFVELYGSGSDPCSIIMREWLKGLLKKKEIGLKFINVGKEAKFLDLQRLGKVPAVCDGDKTFFGSSAIIKNYVENRHIRTKTIADVEKWLASEQNLKSSLQKFVIGNLKENELSPVLHECQKSLSAIFDSPNDFSKTFYSSVNKFVSGQERETLETVSFKGLLEKFSLKNPPEKI